MLEAHGASARFGRRTVVDKVDLVVPDGEVTYLLGLNGAGKTTLLRMLCGLHRPSAGTVLVNGRDPRTLRDGLRELGTAHAANPRHTARRHLTWIARAGGFAVTSVAAAIEVAGIADFADERIGSYSVGMAQRLGIAVALLGDPQTVVLDEPVNGLDIPGIIWTRTLFADLAAQGKCVLVASHLLSEVARTADRVVVMHAGTIRSDTRLSELAPTRDADELEAAYLRIVA